MTAIFPQLFTIGYQGRTVGDLREIVEREMIDLVIDVRARARSSRPEWCKQQLIAALGRAKYEHWPQLGNAGERGWEPMVEPRQIDAAIRAIRGMLDDGKRVLLLCLEIDARKCHRLYVAAAVTAEAVHL